MYQTGFFEQKRFHLSTWGCPRPTRGERHLTCIVSYIGKNLKNSPKIHLWTDFHNSGCKRKLVVQGQRRGQRSRSWEVKVTLGPIFYHFSVARIWGQSSRSRSKVKGQSQRSRSKVNAEVRGQGHGRSRSRRDRFFAIFPPTAFGAKVRGQRSKVKSSRSNVKCQGRGQSQGQRF